MFLTIMELPQCQKVVVVVVFWFFEEETYRFEHLYTDTYSEGNHALIIILMTRPLRFFLLERRAGKRAAPYISTATAAVGSVSCSLCLPSS